MKKLLCLIGICLCISLSSCEKKEDSIPSITKNISLSSEEKKVIAASQQFGFKLTKQSLQLTGNSKNILISPTSIYMALSMVYNGSDGETKAGIAKTLVAEGIDIELLNKTNKKLIAELPQVDNNVKLAIANSIWHSNEFHPLQPFIDVNKENYNAVVKPLDFLNANSKNTINNWVAENTNQKITKIIDNIDPNQVMFLINALYFKGNWKNEFKSENTQNDVFNLAKGQQIQVPFMNQEADLNLYSTPLFQMAELPYGGGNYSMRVILPSEGKTTDDVLIELTNTPWSEMMKNETDLKKRVQLFLPKFKFEFEKRLNEELVIMGMGNAFSDFADFSKITNTSSVKISEVKHKTIIEVDEKGTEAAAVTSVGFTTTNVTPQLKLDRPFLFIIQERSSGAILFTGIVNNPSLSN